MIRVVLADDQALIRGGLRALLEVAGDVEVVGEATNGGQAAALARQLRPDVVLMDIRMPEVDGITAIRRTTPAVTPVQRYGSASPVSRGSSVPRRPSWSRCSCR